MSSSSKQQVTTGVRVRGHVLPPFSQLNISHARYDCEVSWPRVVDCIKYTGVVSSTVRPPLE